MSKKEQMKKIRDELLVATDAPLFNYRKENNYFPVVGEGSHDAKIMLIGEAPGKNEAISGRPFCGAAGKILDELLDSINLDRELVYITNIVKDRPPANRDPLPEEITYYTPYLDRQIEIIKPEIIATLGRFASRYILEHFKVSDYDKPIGTIHGQKFMTDSLEIVPLFHPAAAYLQS